MKTFVLLAAFAIASVPAVVAQTAGDSAKPVQNDAKSGPSKDSVTTNDSVFNPNDTKAEKTSDRAAKGKLPKDKAAKNDTKPVSPPNPPVVDPHENPASPVNTPKPEVPASGK